ncbi:hypothetical protein EAH79_09675 [Sphingomonas koreensis]|nr:hypothetical protein EAH79_09675 [Sphingomonas koreensis]
MIERWFLLHPKSVGESYAEHARVAARFGAAMIVGGAACLVHAVVPALFPRTASGTVAALHARMLARHGDTANEAWQLDYEI